VKWVEWDNISPVTPVQTNITDQMWPGSRGQDQTVQDQDQDPSSCYQDGDLNLNTVNVQEMNKLIDNGAQLLFSRY